MSVIRSAAGGIFAPFGGQQWLDDGIHLPVEVAAGGGSFSVTAEQGSYVLSGQAATLRAGRQILAGQGTYTLSGQAATLRPGRVIAAGQGTYTLTGQSANLVTGAFLLANQGTYSLSGQDATLTYSNPPSELALMNSRQIFMNP